MCGADRGGCSLTAAIVVKDLRKRYKDREAVRGVSFEVAQGEIFGIVGPNGAGKTTTLEMMEGLRRRDGGSVQVLGMDPAREPYRVRERIGVQFQMTAIQEKMRVDEALALFASFYRRRGDVAKLIAMLGLQPYLGQSFKNLSGGWQQRVSLALAAVHDPEIIFLDEPSTGLDPAARRELWEMIRGLREQGKTIVLTTHYMEEAEQLCDRVAMFREGEVALLDQPKRLVARMAGWDYIDFVSDDASLADIERLPCVQRAVETDGCIRVHGDDVQQVALAVLVLADSRGWRIRNLRFAAGTLDDLFVLLAGGEASGEARREGSAAKGEGSVAMGEGSGVV